VRVVSLNAWGGALYEPLAAWLPTVGADVLCLQEVTRTPTVRGWTTFRDADRVLPQRADLFDDVSALLPRHVATYTASDAGPVSTDDGVVHRQEFGLAMVVADTVHVLARTASFVHGTYQEHDDWGVAGRPRVAQGARLAVPGLERAVTVVQLHGLRDPAGKGDTPARRRQAERLVEVVAGLREEGDLVVVCGDLNLLPDSETFRMLAGIGLTDLVGTADTRSSHYTKPVRHAGYLLVSDREAVRGFEVVTHPEVSDHRPLVLDL
jgi:endonuclease/exonuclease/phosphatase family metal-dependent hydrolase